VGSWGALAPCMLAALVLLANEPAAAIESQIFPELAAR
jgi:hypothetical protein